MIDIPVYLDALLDQARSARASDIHIQPYAHHYGVRFRIDGQLLTHTTLEQPLAQQLIARLKVLSQTDVAESRRPQDGMFIKDSCDVRLASFPSIHGEKVVLRLLDQQALITDLSLLGLSQKYQERLIALANKPGFIIVTGPTGSGKSTTLHALLAHVATSSKNCVTLEDPVEYTIEGITQTQVHPQIGLTFEKGLRALLRQDPDIIMVGEIRDTETAQVALQAALTGHTVLSTLHTQDAPSALMRLAHMGLERYIIAAGVKAVVAQRLVRKLCTCKQQIKTPEELVDQLGTTTYGPQDCKECNFTGYRGRIGVFQLMEISKDLRRLFIEGADYDQLVHGAYGEGMAALSCDGRLLVKAGSISVAEWLAL